MQRWSAVLPKSHHAREKISQEAEEIYRELRRVERKCAVVSLPTATWSVILNLLSEVMEIIDGMSGNSEN